MTFEAGPWHCFGNELLDRLLKIVQQYNVNTWNSQGELFQILSKNFEICLIFTFELL